MGGALAQLVGAIANNETITFNSVGVDGIIEKINDKLDADKKISENPKDYSNITNYSINSDILNMANVVRGYKMLGETYIVHSNNTNMIESHLDFETLMKADKTLSYAEWPLKYYHEYETLINLRGTKIDRSIMKAIRHIFYNKNSLEYLRIKIMVHRAQELYTEAQITKPIVIDPILVDLNGDGVKTTSVENGIYFDHQGDGFMETSAWVDENDGVLAFDKNNNGAIDNGNEIFGDNYIKANGTIAQNGFDALKDLDSNNDGIINSSDEEFNKIKILKGDGTLLTLEEAGIASINLNNSSSNKVDESGNTIVSTGTFVRTDGTVGQLGDYNLQVDKLNSFATEWLDETDEVAILPDVMGSGTMHSLHQAILRDETGELKALFENYLSEENVTNRDNLITDLVYKWAGVENIDPTSRGENIYARKLAALEQFMGEGFIGIDRKSNPNNQAANILEAVLRLGFNQRQEV